MGVGNEACVKDGVGLSANVKVVTPPPRSVARQTSVGVHETSSKALVSLGENTTVSGYQTPLKK